MASVEFFISAVPELSTISLNAEPSEGTLHCKGASRSRLLVLAATNELTIFNTRIDTPKCFEKEDGGGA